MKLLHTISSELLGLFVDDWAFALLVVAWVVLFALLGPHLPPHSLAPAAVFFGGLALLTLVFAARKARQ
jgi:hypothetical protein